jgi:hypothetical protein
MKTIAIVPNKPQPKGKFMKRSQILALVLAATFTYGASAFAEPCQNLAENSAATYVRNHRQTIQAIQSSEITIREQQLLIASDENAKNSMRSGVIANCKLIASQNLLTILLTENYGVYGGSVFDQKVEELSK